MVLKSFSKILLFAALSLFSQAESQDSYCTATPTLYTNGITFRTYCPDKPSATFESTLGFTNMFYINTTYYDPYNNIDTRYLISLKNLYESNDVQQVSYGFGYSSWGDVAYEKKYFSNGTAYYTFNTTYTDFIKVDDRVTWWSAIISGNFSAGYTTPLASAAPASIKYSIQWLNYPFSLPNSSFTLGHFFSSNQAIQYSDESNSINFDQGRLLYTWVPEVVANGGTTVPLSETVYLDRYDNMLPSFYPGTKISVVEYTAKTNAANIFWDPYSAIGNPVNIIVPTGGSSPAVSSGTTNGTDTL